MRASLVLAGALLLLGACKPEPLGPQPSAGSSGPPPLNDQEIRETLVGNTIVGTRTGTRLSDWRMHVAPDGTLADSDGDTGHWTINNSGQFCAEWQIAWHGQAMCYAVYRDSDTVEMRSPEAVVQGKLVEGNKG